MPADLKIGREADAAQGFHEAGSVELGKWDWEEPDKERDMTSEGKPSYPVALERIEGAIIEVRGHKVILDADLAAPYGVSTKRLNEQVRRNAARFPEDFRFRLTAEEYMALRSQTATSNGDPGSEAQFATLGEAESSTTLKTGRGGRRYLPYAFTEHGAVMAATVLNSQRAVEISVFVIRAFVRMRRMLADQRQFALKLAELENKLAAHDEDFKVVFDALRKLMERPKPEPIRKIGFYVREKMAKYDAGPKSPGRK